ncbi:MAG: hypothetical protein K0R44_3203, partial [Thermomicrobiales bacterium]|nr:hypothetical protein [Thermomicrobiales bacterium]
MWFELESAPAVGMWFVELHT